MARIKDIPNKTSDADSKVQDYEINAITQNIDKVIEKTGDVEPDNSTNQLKYAIQEAFKITYLNASNIIYGSDTVTITLSSPNNIMEYYLFTDNDVIDFIIKDITLDKENHGNKLVKINYNGTVYDLVSGTNNVTLNDLYEKRLYKLLFKSDKFYIPIEKYQPNVVNNPTDQDNTFKINNIQKITKSDFNALTDKDPNTIYVVVNDINDVPILKSKRHYKNEIRITFNGSINDINVAYRPINDDNVYMMDKIQYNKLSNEYIFHTDDDIDKIRIIANGISKIYKIDFLYGSAKDISGLLQVDCDVINIHKDFKLNLTSLSYFPSYPEDNIRVKNIFGLEHIDTSNVTRMNYFLSCYLENIPNISGYNTSNVTSISGLLKNYRNKIPPDISSWDVSNVVSLSEFFKYSNIEYMPSVNNWNTSNLLYMSDLFKGCNKLRTCTPIKDWDTSNVITMDYILSSTKITDISLLNNWNTSNVTNLSGAFAYVDQYGDGFDLDLSNWDVSNVTTLSSMLKGSSVKKFYNCNWDTSNCNEFDYFCYNCSKLEALDKLNTTKSGSTKTYLLQNCSNLQSPTSTQLDELRSDNGAVFDGDLC